MQIWSRIESDDRPARYRARRVVVSDNVVMRDPMKDTSASGETIRTHIGGVAPISTLGPYREFPICEQEGCL